VPLAAPRLGAQRLQRALDSFAGFQEILLKSWDESQLLSPKPEAVCHLDDETVRTATEFTLVLRGPYQHDCSSSNADETLDDDDSDQYFPEDDEGDANLESLLCLLLDDVDIQAVQFAGVVLEDITITAATAKFLSRLVATGQVRMLCLLRCQIDVSVLLPWSLFQLSTLECLAFKNCSLSDAHVHAFVDATRRCDVLMSTLRACFSLLHSRYKRRVRALHSCG
jgi:hypothetical protein